MPTASSGPASALPPPSDRGVLPGAPHPLGILPWGSLLFAGDRRDASGNGDGGGGDGDGDDGRKRKKKPRVLASSRSDPRLGLGDLRRLPDAALLLIVASLPARDLASVSCASRALYAFAFSAADGGVEEENEENEKDEEENADVKGKKARKRKKGIGGWRSATLSDFGGSWAWGGTWARTYAAAAWARKEEEKRDEDGEEKVGNEQHASFVAACERALAQHLPRPPPRIRVPLFSDALYETWAATAADPEPWLARDSLPRVDASALSPEEFARRFDGPALPVVLVGAARHWPALEKWRSDEYLQRVLSGEDERKNSDGGQGGNRRRRPGTGTVHVGGVEVSWRHFAEYASTNADDLPLTVFDSKVLSRIATLREDLGAGAPECLPVAREDDGDDDDANENSTGEEKRTKRGAQTRARERDLFSVLPKHLRPDHEWLIAGGRRSGSGFHIDPNATSAWNAVVRGSKKWVLSPPGFPPPGVEPSADLSEVTAPAALADWFRGFYEEAFGGIEGGEAREKGDGGRGERQGGRRHRNQPFFASQHRPLEGIVSAGDAIFVPRGWWHAVLNLETPTIAVTTNFVSRAGLPQALRWVRSRDASLVSGVRGDEARLRLAQRWEEALRQKAPEALAEAEERIAREDAAMEERRREGRALASLFREEGGKGGEGGGEEAAPAPAPAPSSSSFPAAAAPANGGFSFNFAVED